ncbi:PR domain zinc finger protein 10 [Octopus bimaculoides]|uniref:PR domain zinc finger protein 10 n=1 Tax=Octopus bimaculoides TaxID=37653 RepID=A0A0L8HZF4_OCTBM|nr:PR domain zinc finger protein 10 [Octopus bimaculoides]XP_014768415.1 PR domain zinc finger protein 10 [Octopus bimaculoides]|eukprot:XP_014768414.1 PREDICTED: PR domain zinc finger protein 10-like [Octopus bimaculoides]
MESDSSSNQTTVWAAVGQQVQHQQQPPQHPQPSQAQLHQQVQTQQAVLQSAQFVAAPPSNSGTFTVTTAHQGLPILAATPAVAAAAASSTFTAQYVDFQSPQFATYQINIPHGANLYQPAQSSFERISPVDEFQSGEVVSGSDGIATYSTLQTANGTQLIAAPTVDSTTLQHATFHGHHVMNDNLMAVQRVVSPVDCTVSQSTLSLQRDHDSTHQASTIGSVSQHQPMETLSGEPDTTQEDSQDFSSAQVGSGVAFNTDNGIEETNDANGLHSTISSSNGISTTTREVLGVAVSAVSSGQLSSTVDGTNSVSPSVVLERDIGVFQRVEAAQSCIIDNFRRQHHLNSISTDGVADSSAEVDADLSSGAHLAISQNLEEIVARSNNDSANVSSLSHGPNITGASSSGLGNITGPSNFSSNTAGTSNTGPSNITGSSCVSADINGSINGLDNTADSNISSGNIAGSSRGSVNIASNRVSGNAAASNNITNNILNCLEEEKENIPHSKRQLRKSNRIANMEAESSWSSHRRQYKPTKAYNPDELWCEECMATYQNECPEHRLQIVPDKVVLSRAWSSLPPILQIFRLGESTELGVFAKRPIAKSTQFGPFIGEPVANQNQLTNCRFVLMLERENNECFYIEMSDENKCNWMMFVRPAENFAEQNLVAYQHCQDIYFTVSKNIEPRQELKVWYAAHYAERIGAHVLDITDEDIEALDEQERKWPCYECNKRFKTSAALQKHLVVHEENTSNRHQDDDFSIRGETMMQKNRRKGFSLQAGTLKRKRRHPKVSANGEICNYPWKKKSSTFYLNKTLKKYHRRLDHEALRRRSLKSLYRKKGKVTGGNEWVCTHCDLTFDNSNLLNLHTLTHAAEDVGLDEVKRLACDPNEAKPVLANAIQMQQITNGDASNEVASLEESDSVITLDSDVLACPVCFLSFQKQQDLIEHASVHGKTKRKMLHNPQRPHKCQKCWKAFSNYERLQKHLLCHGDENSKPLQCQVCFKRFMNNSALSCHMKTHSDKKYYECPLCHSDFDQVGSLKSHVTEHEDANGKYNCPICTRVFDEFVTIRKHMRAFHSAIKYPCPECDKLFPRPDKLKLHMLRHSSHREFMCESCGRQFKRKDKLKEHMKRMHSEEREARLANKEEKPVNHKKFIPKVSPNDYHRFIYKCHTCLLGFKRRGMLVNHLAKRHPDIKPDTVPELKLPILKTQRDYYCQYCEKVYKSSSKRKAHILKNHPGSELPMSSRKKSQIHEVPGHPNPTYSQMVGSITTMPHQCDFCHKQYASKAKLMQHHRKKHPEMSPPQSSVKRVKEEHTAAMLSDNSHGVTEEEFMAEVHGPVSTQAISDQYQQADLLTQAMTELTQTLSHDYQPSGEYSVARVTNTANPTGHTAMVQIQPAQIGTVSVVGGQPTTTIELSHLGQNLVHTQLAAAAAAANQQQQQTVQTIASLPAADTGQTLTTSHQAISSSLATSPVSVSMTNATLALARTWNNFNFN